MRTPDKIQRLRIKKRGSDTPLNGFDDLFSCDYMGSTEFEMDLQPRSLEAITGSLDDYVCVKVEPKELARDGRRLWLICPKGSEQEIFGYIPRLKTPGKLLESAWLDRTLKGEEFADYDGWWDIENHWLLVLGGRNTKLTMKALQALRERWTASGRIPSRRPGKRS